MIPMEHLAPVGVFDSGLGGLSVLREIRRRLPAEDVIYYADSAFCPYGSRSAPEIRARSEAIAGTLIAEGAKLVVVACNTASSVAITHLRERFDVPFVGLEPAVKPAVRMTQTGKIAVLATPRTVSGERLRWLIDEHARDVEVYTVPAPGLAELVEHGTLAGDEVQGMLRPLLEPSLNRGADVIVLGCTHYPFLRGEIERFIGDRATVIDSGEAIARRTHYLLTKMGALRADAEPGHLQFMTSGIPEVVGDIATNLLGESIQPIAVPA
jgi:glutamate racemase